MGNIIVGLILGLILFFALRGSIRHFRGEGGCCGGSVPKVKQKKLKLMGKEIARKRILIEGMHCVNCKNQIENSLNQIEGIVAEVDLKRNIAVVSMERSVEEEKLKLAVEIVGFKVVGIETISLQ